MPAAQNENSQSCAQFPPSLPLDFAAPGGVAATKQREKSMTKSEIIELTLKQMSYEESPPLDATADYLGHEGYDDVVIAILRERLPQGDIKTCDDLEYLDVECCGSCHDYPHYEFSLETLPDSSKAWICCSVRRAFLNHNFKVDEPPEFVDIEQVLSGDLSDIRGPRS
jgi:hypothetical protein